MKRFFSYDDQNEFELHDTLAEAKAAAEKAFEYCSDEARSEGWPESVDEICYGELRGHVVESLREPWDTDKHGTAPEEGCDHVEYALQDLPHNTALSRPGVPEERMDEERIKRGISAYHHEQQVFLRLLARRGSFTEQEFDSWFRGREWRRPVFKARRITGDTFILGMGVNGGNHWAEMLELLQMMVALGLVDARTKNGAVEYLLGANTGVMRRRREGEPAWDTCEKQKHTRRQARRSK